MKKFLLNAVMASCIGAASLGAQAAAISLINHDFESGNLGGWTSLGDVSATPSTSVTTSGSIVWSINANGTTMAQLNSNGADIAAIETALGLAVGTLNAYNTNPAGGELTNGAMIRQGFAGNAGDTLTLAWDYVARDYIDFNDPAMAILTNPDGTSVITPLASIWGLGIPVGTDGHADWQTITFSLTQTGDHFISFVTTNDKDTVLDSALFIDNVPGSATCNLNVCPTSVPEPASVLLLGLGLLGLRVVRRKFGA